MVKKIPDSHLLALGSVTIEFGKLESILILSISRLLWREVKGIETITTLVGGDSFDVLLIKLNKIFIHKLHDDKLLKDFELLSKRLSAINEKRNRYLHSWWTINEKEGLVRIKFKKKPDKNNLMVDRESFDTDEIITFVEEIKKAEDDLDELTEKIQNTYITKLKEENAKIKKKSMTLNRKLEKPLKLDMNFDEAMKRITRVKVQRKKG